MEATVTVPQISDTQTVEVIELVPGQLNVRGVIKDSDGKIHGVTIDISTEWAAASTENKTVIKAFIKKLGALILDKYNESIGVNVTEQDITGEVWD